MFTKTYIIKMSSYADGDQVGRHWKIKKVPFWSSPVSCITEYLDELTKQYPKREFMLDTLEVVK